MRLNDTTKISFHFSEAVQDVQTQNLIIGSDLINVCYNSLQID